MLRVQNSPTHYYCLTNEMYNANYRNELPTLLFLPTSEYILTYESCTYIPIYAAVEHFVADEKEILSNVEEVYVYICIVLFYLFK